MKASSYDAAVRAPCCVFGIRTRCGSVAEIVFLPKAHAEVAPSNALAERAVRQIERYLDDPARGFSLRVEPGGTPFRRRVWACISAIGPGRTRSYGAIAKELGSAARAVGQACGDNPVPLIVPCHRVVAATGLGGFAHRERGYLIDVKTWLLEHERALQPSR